MCHKITSKGQVTTPQAIGYLGDRLALVINPILLAEVAAVYATPEELDAALPPSIYRRDPLP